MDLSKSLLVLGSPILVEILNFYLVELAGTCPLSVRYCQASVCSLVLSHHNKDWSDNIKALGASQLSGLGQTVL